VEPGLGTSVRNMQLLADQRRLVLNRQPQSRRSAHSPAMPSGVQGLAESLYYKVVDWRGGRLIVRIVIFDREDNFFVPPSSVVVCMNDSTN